VIEIFNYHVSICTSLAVKPLAPLVQKFVLKKKQVFFMLSSIILHNSWLKRQILQKITDDRCSGSRLYGKGHSYVAPVMDLDHNLTIFPDPVSGAHNDALLQNCKIIFDSCIIFNHLKLLVSVLMCKNIKKCTLFRF
jgi:hypothetical protein